MLLTLWQSSVISVQPLRQIVCYPVLHIYNPLTKFDCSYRDLGYLNSLQFSVTPFNYQSRNIEILMRKYVAAESTPWRSSLQVTTNQLSQTC